MNLYISGNKLSKSYAVAACSWCSLTRKNAKLWVDVHIHDALKLGRGFAVEHRYLCELPRGVVNNSPTVARY